MKRSWAQLILRKKKFKLCCVVRVRIALRKEGTIPLSPADPDAEDALVQAEVKAMRFKNITEDDVIAAFSRGDEVLLLFTLLVFARNELTNFVVPFVLSQAMDIIQMTCVKYDHVFASDIEAKLPNFDTLLAASSQKKAATSAGNQAPATSAARPTPDIESEDEEPEHEPEPEQEQEREHEPELEHKQDKEGDKEIEKQPKLEEEQDQLKESPSSPPPANSAPPP